MSKLPIALAHAKRGFKVFPVQVGAKAPPLLSDWPNKATSDPAEVELLWAAVPHANVAIHCTGLLVLDVDSAKGGDDSLALLEDLHQLSVTLTTRTPSGGRHLYFSLPVGHPGVANTVAKLGPGLDTRSNGGYVLAPGSDLDVGRYFFVDPKAAIAPAPEWLLTLLVPKTGSQSPKTGTVAVPDAPESAYDGARAWLEAQAPAIEGQGGDAWTFTVACGLRDRGVSEPQAVELLVAWNETCSPPWELAELRAKAHNAFRYGQNPPGARVALPQDFPIAPTTATVTPTAKVRSRVQRLSEFSNGERRSPGYLVKGLLLRGTYAEAYGAPGQGKTFVTLDLAYAAAAGKPWMERQVHGGLVLYLAYEGVGGLVARGKALRQHYGQKDVPLYVADAAYNLRDLAGRAALGEDIAALPEKPVLIVFDTFARALCGGDENSAQDVGAFNEGVKALIAHSGACVLVVHHTGKDPSKGARGSSALLAALDTEIHIHDGSITPTKQRDIEVGEPIGFKLHPVVVGIDQDGDEQTSCVVVPGVVRQGMERITGNNKRGFDALCDLSPDNAPVSEEAWLEACTGFLPQRGAAKRFWDIKTKLIQRGYIEVDKAGRVTRRME